VYHGGGLIEFDAVLLNVRCFLKVIPSDFHNLVYYSVITEANVKLLGRCNKQVPGR
jgi:hypothetical protein